ncbi:MAG: helix-hairpin-helix domain-containing protein [Methanomassiliicoccaceae archaeon]|nr:helix-hairpin-helix domain-containing protein [Methanomassiliicoccaceae archaeon]
MTDEAIARLMLIPSVSRKCAEGLYLLGIHDINDLKGKDPVEIYSKLRERKDFYAEPCMQNMIKIAVGFANKGIDNAVRIT